MLNCCLYTHTCVWVNLHLISILQNVRCSFSILLCFGLPLILNNKQRMCFQFCKKFEFSSLVFLFLLFKMCGSNKRYSIYLLSCYHVYRSKFRWVHWPLQYVYYSSQFILIFYFLFRPNWASFSLKFLLKTKFKFCLEKINFVAFQNEKILALSLLQVVPLNQWGQMSPISSIMS